MNLERHSNPASVARRAADLVADVCRRNPEAALLLPAGGTPVLLYAELVRRDASRELDLARTHLFQLDELIGVNGEDERSFQRFLRTHLLEPLGRANGRDHLLDGTAAAPDAEIERHAEELEELGGAELVVLGIGTNGHVAFNEPGSDLDAGARVVELASDTRASMRDRFGDGDGPLRGMTLGMREIRGARTIVLIATGASKSEIVAALVRDPAEPARPASLLGGHPDFHVLVDEGAASRLDPDEG